MSLPAHFADLARNNAWSNRRLHGACAELSAAEFAAPRAGFFPSLAATLNHILVVDRYYLDGLEGGGRGLAEVADPLPFPRRAELAAAQRECDARLIRFCESLAPEDLERRVTLDRGDDPHRHTHQIVVPRATWPGEVFRIERG